MNTLNLVLQYTININNLREDAFMRGLFFNTSLLSHTKSKWSFWIWLSKHLH